MLFSIAKDSLLSRKKTVFLTFCSLVISLLVLLSVEHIRLQAKESFNRTISSTDLIVGGPSGQLNLLLYSVFRIGTPTANIKYESFQALNEKRLVKWTIPISLGDSHKGFRVLGTNSDYFEHFRYGKKKPLALSQGKQLETLFDTVIGADVAKTLGYQVGDQIVITHGIGKVGFTNHDKSPFVIAGILERTGTPVDKTVHVSLEAIEAIHLTPAKLQKVIADPNSVDLTPKSVTAVLVGLKNKFATFKIQRDISQDPNDRMMAILPGVAMTELWSLLGSVENILRVIAALVLLSSLFGLSTMLLASMNERQAEIAIFRVLGAGPVKIMLLIFVEAILLALSAIIFSVMLITAILYGFEDFLASEYGLFISSNILSLDVVKLLGVVLVATIVTALFPAIEAYKSALYRQLSKR